jgi:hypothetical protein
VDEVGLKYSPTDSVVFLGTYDASWDGDVDDLNQRHHHNANDGIPTAEIPCRLKDEVVQNAPRHCHDCHCSAGVAELLENR